MEFKHLPNFQHNTPALRLFSGDDCLKSLERELRRLGSSRAMIMCGGTIGRSAAIMDKVRAAAGDRLAGVYTGVKAHSPVPDVIAAAHALRDTDADCVIAIGGGSAIVTARAASILLVEGEDVPALATRLGDDGRLISPRLDKPKLPQIILPTTPTTAIVKAGSALFDPATSARLALFDPKTRTQSVFLDPDLLATIPDELLASASVNSLALAIEGLISVTGNPIADGQLMHTLRLINQRLGGDAAEVTPDARTDLVVAGILCGQGTDHSGAGITIVLGHAIAARQHVEAGAVNAIILPHALRFNGDAGGEGLIKSAAAFGSPVSNVAEAREAVISATQKLFTRLGCPSRLRDIGVERDDFAAIAEAALGDWFLKGNPRPVSGAADLTEILEAAW